MIAPPLTADQTPLNLPDADLREEAARYTLMRRLAPALRHHLAGEFQPMTIMAALIERQIKQQAPTGDVAEHASALGQLSKKAAAHCISLINWVVPVQAGSIDLQTALDDCLRVVSTDLRLQGFQLIHHPYEGTLRVAGSSMRTVLPAALLHLSDHASGPGQLHLRMQTRGTKLWLDIEVVLTEAEMPSEDRPNYRVMQWGDVQALAQAEKVGLEALNQGLRLKVNAGTG